MAGGRDWTVALLQEQFSRNSILRGTVVSSMELEPSETLFNTFEDYLEQSTLPAAEKWGEKLLELGVSRDLSERGRRRRRGGSPGR